MGRPGVPSDFIDFGWVRSVKSVTLPTRFVSKNDLAAVVSPEAIAKTVTYIVTLKSLAAAIEIQPGEIVEWKVDNRYKLWLIRQRPKPKKRKIP